MSDTNPSKEQEKVEDTIKDVAELRQHVRGMKDDIGELEGEFGEEYEDKERKETMKIIKRVLEQLDDLSDSYISTLILYESKIGYERRLEEKIEDMKKPTYADDKPTPEKQCERTYYLNGYNKALSDVLDMFRESI